MNNKEAFEFFSNLASDNPNEVSVKISKNGTSDFSQFDAEFILKYANGASSVLDLGSGTGLIVNKICNNVSKIIALEPFPEFSKFIHKSKTIQIVNDNIWTCQINEQFDLITMFGLMNYFNEEEAVKIYEMIIKNLKCCGKIIVKNQFGINEDITISGFSEELQKNYFSQYRYINKEVKILENIGYKNIDVVDIYPPECNRWENTHFYAIVADV